MITLYAIIVTQEMSRVAYISHLHTGLAIIMHFALLVKLIGIEIPGLLIQQSTPWLFSVRIP
jgi:hypothetical protein